MRTLITKLGKSFIKPEQKPIPKSAKRILIIRSGGLGDVIMTTPLLGAVRNRYKNAYIAYLVGTWSSIALKSNPNVDEIIEFDDALVFKKKARKLWQLIKLIQSKQFDVCLILEKSYHWNMIPYLAKIPYRIGFNRAGEGFPNNKSVQFDATKHEMDYYAEIASALGIKAKALGKTELPELYPTSGDKKNAKQFMKKHNLQSAKKKKHNKNKILIGIAPGGAENPGQKMLSKRWPLEKYCGLVNLLIENNALQVLLFGGKSDIGVCESIKQQSIHPNQVTNCAGTDIHTTFLIMKECNLIITHDSGPMHIASASGTKLIALFGPTDPRRFAPSKALVIQSPLESCPCYDMYGNYDKEIAEKCMPAISTDTVYQEVKKLIKGE